MRTTLRTTLIIAASLAGMAGLSTQALASGGDRSLKHQYSSERDHGRQAQRGHRGNRDYNRHERRGHRNQQRQHNRHYNRYYSGHNYDRGHWSYATHNPYHNYSYYGYHSGIYIVSPGLNLHLN